VDSNIISTKTHRYFATRQHTIQGSRNGKLLKNSFKITTNTLDKKKLKTLKSEVPILFAGQIPFILPNQWYQITAG